MRAPWDRVEISSPGPSPRLAFTQTCRVRNDVWLSFPEPFREGMEVTVAEYRTGNMKENSVQKITGINKATDVTLKRGVIGSLDLYPWLDQIRNGDQAAYRTVTVQLQNEDHTAVVQTWKLLRARIIKHVSGPMNAKGTDVAMEELTLAYERLQME